jgi:hypothetical protein
MSENAGSVRITRLILIPLAITLAITFLRLEGELHHWSSALFNRSAGGMGAIVGIASLPFIFGPYFAAKLAAAGEAAASGGKVLLYAGIGVVVTIAGGVISAGSPEGVLTGRALTAMLLIVAAALIQFMASGTLARTLLAYGFGARLPVAIVMFYAMAGSWGTHYDALPPNYAGPTDFMGRYIAMALIPQFIFWIAYTMITGALAGGVYLAIAHRGKAVPQPA